MASNYAEEVLTSVGTKVYVNGTLIEGAVSYSDLGGDSEELDASGICHEYTIKKPGRKDLPAWELTYNENATDIATIDACSGTVALKIEHNDGSTLTNTGELASNYELGGSPNGIHQYKAKFTLTSGAGWTRTEPTP